MRTPRSLAPAGTRIRAGEVVRWLGGSVRPGSGLAGFERHLRQRFGLCEVFLLSSGRAAMSLALQAMRDEESDRAAKEGRVARDEVIVPGYTCYSVAASVARAGLRVRPVDIDADTLDFNLEALATTDTGRVLAITASSLYGIPSDLVWLEAFARARSIWMIDDAAQAMGARVGSLFAGSFGDVGVHSLDKGKNITTIQGGVLSCRDEALAVRLGAMVSALPRPRPARVLREMIMLGAYAVLLRPNFYWLPDRLLDLGGTPWETSFPMTRFSGRLAPMASLLLERLDQITEGRREAAEKHLLAIEASGLACMIDVPGSRPSGPGAIPVYPRLPLLLPDARTRDRALAVLSDAKLGASASYPRAVVDVPEVSGHLAPGVGDTPTARSVAGRILTLPTHAFVTDLDVERIVALLGDVVRADPGSATHQV